MPWKKRCSHDIHVAQGNILRARKAWPTYWGSSYQTDGSCRLLFQHGRGWSFRSDASIICSITSNCQVVEKVFHLLNLIMLNSYKLYLKYESPSANRSHQKFRAALVRALVESATGAPIQTTTPRRRGDPVGRIQGQHFPVHMQARADAEKKRPQRDCVVCNMKAKHRVGHKRKQTVLMCDWT